MWYICLTLCFAFCLWLLRFFSSFVFIFQLVGQFIARAVSDQILSKSYIEGYKGRVDCEYARYVCLFCGFIFLFDDIIVQVLKDNIRL